MAKKRKSTFVVSLLLLCIIIGGGFFIYQKYFAGKIHLKDRNYTFIFIGRDDSFEDVIQDINAEGIIEDPEAFEWLAKKMDLDRNINPGKYRITNGMNMRQIVNLIKYNKQEKIKLTYNSQIHNLDEFIMYTDEKLEVTEEELEDYLGDEEKLRLDFGLDPASAFALVVPGVYEVSWAISCEALIKLFKDRYDKIWNAQRKALAKRSGYSVPELMVIASIVQCESHIESEQEKIAGVYINRLKTGMPLQADPTLRFANKAFDVQRFWDSDKEINSPYNTYRFRGLPPGPICLVYPQSIDATLNYAKHKFIYFCAKPQLNGYSDFSTSYDQHRKFASAYQKALAKRGISR